MSSTSRAAMDGVPHCLSMMCIASRNRAATLPTSLSRTFYASWKGMVFTAQSKPANSTHFHPSPDASRSLPLKELGTVWVLDNRLERETIPLEQYVVELNTHVAPQCGVRFEGIERAAVTTHHSLLILIDAPAAAFDEGGALAEEEDPYQTLYHDPTMLSVPKQSFNVNANDESGLSRDMYLQYEMLDRREKSVQMKAYVAINELYLKTRVVRHETVVGELPLLPKPTAFQLRRPSLATYAFIRKRNKEGQAYHVCMYIANERLHFLRSGGCEPAPYLARPMCERVEFSMA